MTKPRVWHASRDAYHCAFRLTRLLLSADHAIEFERIRVLDMLLLYPPLLHRASMPLAVRNAFSALAISRPEKIFISLPSAASVFQDLRLYQNSAVALLKAQRLINIEALKEGMLSQSAHGFPQALIAQATLRNEEDGGLTAFLTGLFSTIPLRGTESLFRKMHLPSRSIAA